MDDCRPPGQRLRQSVRIKRLLAQWAQTVGLGPLFDAVRVEVMPFVAGERRDHVVALKSLQADDALLVLRKLGPVEHARQPGQGRVRLSSSLRVHPIAVLILAPAEQERDQD